MTVRTTRNCATAAEMEDAVNKALQRVVNDNVPLVDVLDEVFRAGTVAGRQGMAHDVAVASRSLASTAAVVRAGRELGSADPAGYAAGLDAARETLRRYTGVA